MAFRNPGETNHSNRAVKDKEQLWERGRPAGPLTPGLLHQEAHEGEEEEAGDGDEARQPLGQRPLADLPLH